jgi:hypothetical protein
VKAKLTLEIEISDDIENLYPNFKYNYQDKLEFLQSIVSALNHNIEISEQSFYNEYHQSHNCNDYKLPNDGYKIKVTAVSKA